MNTVISRLTPLALCLSTALMPVVPVRAQTPATAAAPRALTAEQWREDLRFMVEEMERRHPDLYHNVSRDDLQAAVADLHRRIPQLRRNEIIVGMMRIAAMIGDGHTRVDPRKDPEFGFPSLPLKLYLFEDGLYVRAARPDQAALVGARIEAIGGVPAAEAIRRASELVSRDNPMGATFFAPIYLNMPDILHALGLSSSPDRAELTLSRGERRWTADVAAGEVDPIWPPDTDISLVTPDGWVDARTTPQPPMWLQAPLDYHRLVELPEQDALYAQLNMVANVEGQTLSEFGARIRERAEAVNPRAVILDLRLNFGGGGHLRHRFVRELIKTEDSDTRLFVLTWRGSFSATQFILDDLDRLTDAIFIGEPASSSPSSFGDAYRMPMPNSGIDIRTSILWWQEGQNRSPWTWVDVAAPLTFADYAAGRDPALRTALDYTPRPPLRERLSEASQAGGVAAVRAALAAYADDPANRWVNLPIQMVQAAEGLHAAGQREAALIVARLGSERFPDHAVAANVHAHIAAAQGQDDEALVAARRVLELDPNNRQARSLRERLEAAR